MRSTIGSGGAQACEVDLRVDEGCRSVSKERSNDGGDGVRHAGQLEDEPIG